MALAAGFDPNLSGRQNAVISGMLIGHSKKEVTTWLEEIKAFSELNVFFEKPVKTYSSGMRARLGFSIAMYTSPDVLLIDEVLGVGDANFKQKAEAAITDKINSEITVILVSHSEAQMKRLCDRVIWLDSGIVKSEGVTNTVFREYNLYFDFLLKGININEFKLNNDFVLYFEKLEVRKDKLLFNLVLFSTKNEQIKQVQIISEQNKSRILDGPKNTPNYFKCYPQYSFAKQARFNGGVFFPNLENKIIVEFENENVEVFRIKFL